MQLRKILHQAFSISTNKPSLWLFGLIVYGGFNLYLINLFAFRTGRYFRDWLSLLNLTLDSKSYLYLIVFALVVLAILVVSFVKTKFVISLHGILHSSSEFEETNKFDPECLLCVNVKNKTVPVGKYFANLLLASSVTIGFTSSIVLFGNYLFNQYGSVLVFPVIINSVFILSVTALLGVWNLFTGYLIILHDFEFPLAAKTAIDLMLVKAKTILEFTFIVCLLYFGATIVGNTFINIWNHAFLVAGMPFLRIVALVGFLFWFAANNTFFNTAFLIFFNELIKSVKVKKGVLENGHNTVNVVN